MSEGYEVTSELPGRPAQSRNDIKAEKRDGLYFENDTLFASPSIYEIVCCDLNNYENQEEDTGKKWKNPAT